VPLATCAAIIRPLGAEPIPIRDLERVSGIAKKEWSTATNRLAKDGLAVVGAAPGGAAKAIWLSTAGLALKHSYPAQLSEVEAEVRTRGPAEFDALRRECEAVVDDAIGWTTPSPELWRAKAKTPHVLAHHPLITHRGGYPDGS
jgi:hypothetical protein